MHISTRNLFHLFLLDRIRGGGQSPIAHTRPSALSGQISPNLELSLALEGPSILLVQHTDAIDELLNTQRQHKFPTISPTRQVEKEW